MLEGGSLSHVYYILLRHNSNVAVKHPPDMQPTISSFQKLVRDQIPETVARRGELAKVSRLRPEELSAALRIKLVEEALEVRDAEEAELVQEIADVLEVVESLAKSADISKEAIESARASKRTKRGGFAGGVVLHETQSAERPPTEEQMLGMEMFEMQARGSVVEALDRPNLESVNPGAFDFRRGDGFVELVHSSEVRLTLPEWVIVSPRRVRIEPEVAVRQVDWQLEGRRRGGQLQLRLKVTIGTRQLLLPLTWTGE